MKLLVFGMLAEDIGNEAVEMNLPKDTDSLRMVLLEKYPALVNRQFMVAVNQQKVDANIGLTNNDEIAIIPPFAGG
jgi:molybdopterin synthase sulfur carrier subunit